MRDWTDNPVDFEAGAISGEHFSLSQGYVLKKTHFHKAKKALYKSKEEPT